MSRIIRFSGEWVKAAPNATSKSKALMTVNKINRTLGIRPSKMTKITRKQSKIAKYMLDAAIDLAMYTSSGIANLRRYRLCSISEFVPRDRASEKANHGKSPHAILRPAPRVPRRGFLDTTTPDSTAPKTKTMVSGYATCQITPKLVPAYRVLTSESALTSMYLR